MAEKKTAAVVESPTEARIINYIKAAYPILWLQTAEESRAERELLNIAKKMQRRISVWSFTEGFLNLQEDGKESRASGDASSEDPIEALKKIKDEAANVGQIYIFRDLHAFFNNPKVVRLLRDIAREFKQGKKVLVVLSPLNKLPPEAERDITLVDYELPNRPVITKIWDNMYAKNKTAIVKTNGDKEFSADEHEKISQAALGLTTVEAENAFGKAVIEWAALPIEDRPSISALVMKEKAAAVKKSGILEYFERRESIKDIGGLEALKSWLDVRKRALSLSAREFGLPMPRGILLVGLPGCGKSLVAKATAGILGVPLIRFDIGRVFAGLVGQSEMNMRSALQTIDAIGNCVVWIDEMEKAFAGMGSSSTTDSGVSQRVFGSLITWMQEKSSPSFMVATVNRIEGLPPELLRKGRFDEIFFVDLPTAKERLEILKIHLEKDRRTEEFQSGSWRYKFDEVFKNKSELENCIASSENFSGAELEEAIVTALYTAYYRDDKAPDKFGLYIYGAIQNTRALAKTNEGQLKAMKTWAENNAVHASIKAGTKKADARTLDIG